MDKSKSVEIHLFMRYLWTDLRRRTSETIDREEDRPKE